MERDIYPIDVLSNGILQPGTIEVVELDRNWRLILETAGRHEEVDASDCFHALQLLREKIRPDGYDIVCYGSSRHVYPSGMSRDMSGGLMAHKLYVGQQGQMKDVVRIFDTGPDVDLASAEEQDAFYQSWFGSWLRKPL
jgi:hypothetical protein